MLVKPSSNKEFPTAIRVTMKKDPIFLLLKYFVFIKEIKKRNTKEIKITTKNPLYQILPSM